MYISNKHYKQILIDLENYKALKDLGKVGDSFNDVVRALLTKTNASKDLSVEELNIENVIEINPDNKSFVLKLDSGLRKVGIDRILGFKDHLRIDFLYDDCLNVDYPNDLLGLSKKVEWALLNSNLQLPNYVVKRIVNYLEEHAYKIEAGIARL